jgi:hypothetical protein
MDFDHVIEVLPDGSVIDGPKDLWAPGLNEGELDRPYRNGVQVPWEFFTTGYSGQDRYSGPIMHNSEFIGGGLERDILAQPGYYASIVCSWFPEDDDEDQETDIEGWAVVCLAKEDWA